MERVVDVCSADYYFQGESPVTERSEVCVYSEICVSWRVQDEELIVERLDPGSIDCIQEESVTPFRGCRRMFNLLFVCPPPHSVKEVLLMTRIISLTDRTLPTKPCSRCHNRFHASCLFKWFNSSHTSSCPLCRELF
jgi:hypothetical protein